MDSTQQPQNSAPTLERQNSFSPDDEATLRNSSSPTGPRDSTNEYDPCQNAKISSPFYLYNHDSPRPSQDVRPGKPSIHVSIRDLELGQQVTPSISQEKFAAQAKKQSFTDKLKFWDQSRRQQCMTKPKKQWWLQRLPKKQRVMVKSLIAFLITGAIIGIAVGVAAAVHSGIYGSSKTIGT